MFIPLILAIGLAIVLVRTNEQGRRLTPLFFKHWPWLLFIFAIKSAAFGGTELAQLIPNTLAKIILISCQLGLIWIALANRQKAAFKLALIGASLNLLVIGLNGGFMPITPDAAQVVYPDAAPGSWQVGQRLGTGKDIVLEKEDTLLWPLSDCMLTSEWLPRETVLKLGTGFQGLSQRIAFSIGDVFLVLAIVLEIAILTKEALPIKTRPNWKKKHGRNQNDPCGETGDG